MGDALCKYIFFQLKTFRHSRAVVTLGQPAFNSYYEIMLETFDYFLLKPTSLIHFVMPQFLIIQCVVS